jgi:hypothetical protein
MNQSIFCFILKKSHISLFLTLNVLIIASCKKLEFERTMDVSTDRVEKNGTSVIVHGTLLDLGSNTIIEHGHCWSTEPEPDINDFHSNLGIIEGTGDFFSKLDNLSPGKTHFFRSYIFDGNEYKYGAADTFNINADDIQFVISSIQKIDPKSIKAISSTTGIGSVNFSKHGHCWSQTDPPTIDDNKTGFGTYDSDTTFESILKNLTFGRYYIRGYLEANEFITYTSTFVYESQIALETNEIIPNPDQSITVNGKITSLGIKPIINYGHCWSTLTSLPDLNNLSEHNVVGITNQMVSYSSQLTGLVNGRFYYTRSYATDGDRVYYGEIKSFIAN